MKPEYIQEVLDLEIEDKLIGYSTGKWSDDDDIWNPITPFFGRSK